MTTPRVSVSASVEREVVPDSFVLGAHVRGRGGSSAAALAELATRYAELEQAVAALPGSVSVRHGSITTWSDGGRRSTWYAQRGLSVTGTDPVAVADTVAVLTAVRDCAVDGPHWRVGREHPAHAELQADVVAQARGRAERYAAALGGELGRLVELRDPGADGEWAQPVALAFRAQGEAGDVADLDLTPQPQTVSATVNATWELALPE